MALGAQGRDPELLWWRESMKSRSERLEWWRKARFGMFVHWGVYSLLGGVWEGSPVKGYAEHIQRICKIPISRYREEVAARFNPVHFDAEAWVRLAKDAGMGYFIITAKHHDGFAMYDSEVSEYNIVKATPFRRDPIRELKEACDRHGIRFGLYYSQAFDWGDANAPGNDWDYQNPGGDLRLHGGAEWWKESPHLLPQVRRYVDGKAIPQILELLRKYDPAILWFDTPHKLPPEENLRILRAVREAKPDVVVNRRICQSTPEHHYGDYYSTADKPDEFPPTDHLPPPSDDWEAIPTTNESYGYHQADRSHKPTSYFIHLLAKAAARGGNVLLNVGPMGDGRIDPADVAILEGIGAWMRRNGPSIHATSRTPLPVQSWGESTRKENSLYLHVFDWPSTGRLVVGGLRSSVRMAYLLADGTPLPFRRSGELDVEVQLPPKAPDPVDSVVVLELDGGVETDDARLLAAAGHVNRLHVFDGRIHGERLRFGAGKVANAYVEGWRDEAEYVSWPVRLAETATFDVSTAYDADERTAGGDFLVEIGPATLAGTVRPNARDAHLLGQVTLAPGRFEVVVRPTKISKDELMRLRSVTLSPV